MPSSLAQGARTGTELRVVPGGPAPVRGGVGTLRGLPREQLGVIGSDPERARGGQAGGVPRGQGADTLEVDAAACHEQVDVPRVWRADRGAGPELSATEDRDTPMHCAGPFVPPARRDGNESARVHGLGDVALLVRRFDA